MHSSLSFVAARSLRMMRRLFMLTKIVVASRFSVMLGGVRAVL